MSGAGLAVGLSLWAALSAEDETVLLASGKPTAQAGRRLPLAPALLDQPVAPTPLKAAQPAASPPPRPATAAGFVPITMAAAHRLQVGEMSELVVSVGSNPGVGEVGFTIQFDPNVLQVRAGTQGDWATRAGTAARFDAAIPGGEDRVQIRSTVSGPRGDGTGGIVAIVQFQAVAPGFTSVTISDVAVKDSTGGAMATAVSASSVPVAVESVLPLQPAAWHAPGEVAADPAVAEVAADGD